MQDRQAYFGRTVTRAIMQQEALSDDIFEELLALHILMQRIIETK
ncbi:hypothetical protein [Paracoccus aestuarii]|nr:hypothetical protein [Paracoccus aestuarii]